MLSLTAWMGLAFIWAVLSCVVAGMITWSFQMRQPMHLGWATYDKEGKKSYGVVACFTLMWVGIFALGTILVQAVRFIKYSAEIFAWLDGWFM
jgi:hypothetical protein